MRFAVLRASGFRCHYCGNRPPAAVLQVEHRLSLADGGTDALDNLVAACGECNRGKGADSLTDTGMPVALPEISRWAP